MKNYRVKMINGGSFSNIDTALDFQSNGGKVYRQILSIIKRIPIFKLIQC